MPYVDISRDPGSFPNTSILNGPYPALTELPLGQWKVMANGRVYTLDIQKESGGAVVADLDSGNIVDAKWSVRDQILKFTRVVPKVVEQSWVGYLMAIDRDEDPKWRMAGTLKNIRSLNDHAVPLTTGGWYATQNRR